MKIMKFLHNPALIPYKLQQFGLGFLVSDRAYTKSAFLAHFGYPLNLHDPKTFNEKINWLKIYDRKAEYSTYVDKVLVKEYVGRIIGKEHIIPTLSVWDSAEAIDFERLPEKFVLKCNHDSGNVVVCKDKSKLNWEKTKRMLSKCLNTDYYRVSREWPYKNVNRKILAETLIEGPHSDDLMDYKIMCFNGKAKCSFVCTDRNMNDGLHVTFFDREWNKLPFARHYPISKTEIPKPQHYEEMLFMAEQLAKNFIFVRVDFYEANDKVYFGELTLYPGSGFEEFNPVSWDYELGSWLHLK